MPGIPNRGSAGAVLDATNYGLIRVEGGAVWFPGVIGTGLEGPANLTFAAAIVATGGCDYIARVNPRDWLDGTDVRHIFGNQGSGAPGLAMYLYQGKIHVAYGGNSTTNVNSSVALPFSNGDAGWVRVRIEGNNGTNAVFTFYTAADQTDEPTVWDVLEVVSPPSRTWVDYNGLLQIGRRSNQLDNWFDGSIHNCIFRDFDGNTLLEFNAATDISDPAATTLRASTGQTITVNRAASGPVTTLVPEGTVVYVNPDNTDAGNLITIPQSETFDIADGESFVMAWTGNVPPDIPLYEQYFGIGNDTAGNPGYGIRAHAAIEGIYAFARSDLEVSRASNVLSLASNRPAVHAIRIDRSTNPTPHVEHFYYNPNRNRSINQTIAAGWTATTTVGPTLLKRLASTASSWLFKKGVVTDDELDAIARRLLVNASRPARNTTGPVPPASPVYGDRWRAENGDTAKFNGAEWEPISPSTGVNMAELLGNAVLLLDAKGSVPGEQYALNRGNGGHVLNARYGSSTAVDTNDPLFLPHTGENYVYLPGTSASNRLQVPSASVNVAGDLDIRFALDVDSVASIGSNGVPIAKWGGGVQRCYAVRLSNTGVINLWTTPNGTFDSYVVGASAAGRITNGVQSVRVTLDVDDGAGNRVYRYYVAPGASEPSNWDSHLVETKTVVGTTSVFAGTDNLWLGGWEAAGFDTPWKIYWAQVRSGIGGTPVFDFNAATDIVNAGPTSFTATSGQTVTLWRANTGRKTALVTRPIWLFGTDDYMEVPDNALLDFSGEDFTVLAIQRQWATVSAGDEVLVTKNSNIYGTSTPGYALYTRGGATNANFFRVSDGVTNVNDQSPGFTLGELQAVVGTYEAGVGVGAGINALGPTPSPDTTTGVFTTTVDLRVGRFLSAGGGPYDGEIVAVAVWRRALTTDEIAALNTYYGTA